MTDKHILVVEDEADGRLLMRTLLAEAAISVDVARSGAEAWAKLSQNSYAAAIIDLVLPDMDGVELLKKLRADLRVTPLPCIAITAYHTPGLKQDCISVGFDGYCQKPIDRTLFITLLDNVTGGL